MFEYAYKAVRNPVGKSIDNHQYQCLDHTNGISSCCLKFATNGIIW